jgi:hypothetical protein
MAIFSSFYSPGNCVPIILTKANGKKIHKKRADQIGPFAF